MRALRALLKSAAEHALGSTALGKFRLGTDRGSLILAYHNVVPEPGGRVGDRSLHLGFDLFRRHLDLLAKRLSIVSFDQVLLGKATDGSAVLTFDDAYASAVRLAVPELAQRGIPATVFITPGLLGLG